jgi:pilus assembly protein TadC
MNLGYLLPLGCAAFALLAYAVRRFQQQRSTRQRLFQEVEPPAALATDTEPTALARWLALAGYRAPGATTLFVAANVGTFVAALAVPLAYRASGISRQMERGLQGMPGAAGEIFLPFVVLAPWIVALALIAAPWLIVRQARRQRVQDVEQDLPIYLELFATLSEAGLGFDAALDRVLRAQRGRRPLASELRTFQLEVLAGRQRTDCLRRLAQRLDVLTLTLFVSALVQAEQVGSGVAQVLRRQSDDLRERRRERLLAQAMTLPVKLVFPLVVCFLPGIFAVTIGPIFYQFFQLVEGLLRSRGIG